MREAQTELAHVSRVTTMGELAASIAQEDTLAGQALAEAHFTGALVAVRDSGPGLDPESLERLFEPFYTTKTKGMGLGLAISRSILEAHGGRLWATANVPNGAVFQFMLPTPVRVESESR